ncbi:Olfactory receptor 8H3 [Heterocephalus glaber]|uniref:Olfactory receptor 8H3 n=1 Tax=Heterocephalus glaber TaxID=10181 RepID=G5BIX3_HETGA|nr:Olfactory receptor 8H3 [Heterocephalus glaber]
MSRWTSTNVPGFILMGLTDYAESQLVLSVLFLLIYLITVLGNAGMILIIRMDGQLHTPMYFFMIGSVHSTVNSVSMNRLRFCNSNIIQHFFCDTSPILALSCSDTYEFELIILICAGSILLLSFIIISGSYLSILPTILKINSTAGKKKAFSTSTSNLLGVTIFYSTMIFTYLKPKMSYTLGRDQVASVFYTIVIPMLNPLIYSLRNKEVKGAAIRVLQKTACSR